MTQITFTGTRVKKLEIETEQKGLENNFTLNYKPLYREEPHKSFVVSFSLEISSKERETLITIEYLGFFDTDILVTEEFQSSGFPRVNAPAIVYPYLRSFISTLTLNAGIEPVIMPTLNFKKIDADNISARQQELELKNK